jgi:hypothetical protein
MHAAAPGESPRVLTHESLLAWYAAKGIEPPAPWNPPDPIPSNLGYEPDPSVFPDSIQAQIRLRAQQSGVSMTEWLGRQTDQPAFALPAYFSRKGAPGSEPGEPITGARRLADFQNENQLGCCLAAARDAWHLAIGGAMASTFTAPADPIFYFGVAATLLRVREEYRAIGSAGGVQRGESKRGAAEFTPSERAWLEKQIATGERLRECAQSFEVRDRRGWDVAPA